ncbi:dihydrodipicolinate synthase family protein [Micromonospora avicenniae]|uniref:dihydrodipicolinate synthase family protein n=1 Tax=Micromonospora avicenniae TaxID=1198245 RepID=UPI00332F7967
MMLSGVYVPLITPFDAAGAVARPALEGLAHEVLDAGAAGLVALGTTAEPGSLDAEEQEAVVDLLARVCRERDAPLLVGASTPTAVTALGARRELTAALSLVPPFVRPGESGVVAHFAALAAASPVPLVIYHVPYRTGQQLSPETLRRLAALPGVIGVKLAVGAIEADTVRLLADPPTGFAVLGGDDTVISPLLALGAHGAVLASAHLATAGFVELAGAWHRGDTNQARELGHRLAELSAALFAAPNPTVVKAVLHAQGRIPAPTVRLPLVPPDDEIVHAAVERLTAVSGASAVAMR